MKKTTRKLLLSLYQVDDQRPSINSSNIDIICPELTKSGRQSLIRLLSRRNWIITTPNVDGKTLVRSTSLGKAALEAEIRLLQPSVNNQSGKWTAILFCQSSKRDPNFRNLRRIVIAAGGAALSRGMYVFPGNLPAHVSTLATSLYQNTISIFTIDRWVFGKDPDALYSKLGISQVVLAYSSISKEAEELLSILEDENRLNNKRKRQLSVLIERLYLSMEEDQPLSSRFVSEEMTYKVPLLLVQKLLIRL